MSILFFVLSCIASLADILPAAPGFITKMNSSGVVTRTLATLGALAFMIGLLTTITWRISFGRDVDEFNQRIADANGNPALVASLSNGFTSEFPSFPQSIRITILQVAEFLFVSLTFSDVGRFLFPNASPCCPVLQTAHASPRSRWKALDNDLAFLAILFFSFLSHPPPS